MLLGLKKAFEKPILLSSKRQALTFIMRDSMPKRSVINNPHTHTGIAVLAFYGMTSLAGRQTSTDPANFNSISASASASASRGFRATNNGTLVQDGSGHLAT